MNKEKLNNLAREINGAIRDWQVREQEEGWPVEVEVDWIEVGTSSEPYKVIPFTKV